MNINIVLHYTRHGQYDKLQLQHQRMVITWFSTLQILQHWDALELDDLEMGISRILAWLTRSNLGQQNESESGGSSVRETMHPREAYPGGAIGYQKKASSRPFLTIWATLVYCTGLAEISGLSALKSMPRAGGSTLRKKTNKCAKGIRLHPVE